MRYPNWMRRYTARRTVFVTVTLCLLYDLLYLTRALYAPLGTFLQNQRVFELVSAAALSQLLLLALQLIEKDHHLAVQTEEETSRELRQYLGGNKSVHIVQLLSAGLSSRLNLIDDLVRGWGFDGNIEIVAQDPATYLDKRDAGILPQTLAIRRAEWGPRVDVRLSQDPVTIRAIIACDEQRRPQWAVAGWYVYTRSGGEVHIKGRNSPALVLDVSRRPEDAAVLAWLERTFESARNRHPPNPQPPGS